MPNFFEIDFVKKVKIKCHNISTFHVKVEMLWLLKTFGNVTKKIKVKLQLSKEKLNSQKRCFSRNLVWISFLPYQFGKLTCQRCFKKIKSKISEHIYAPIGDCLLKNTSMIRQICRRSWIPASLSGDEVYPWRNTAALDRCVEFLPPSKDHNWRTRRTWRDRSHTLSQS